MTGREWLAWFVTQPQSRCPTCRHMNEDNPPPWWRGNCRHARAPNVEKAPAATP